MAWTTRERTFRCQDCGKIEVTAAKNKIRCDRCAEKRYRKGDRKREQDAER